MPAQATDLSRGQNTVNNICQADPRRCLPVPRLPPGGPTHQRLQAQTQDPVHQRAPPSIKSYNPKNDPDVQKGWDDHQTQYGHDDDDE
ncbi:MAG: hypothetical protein R2857_13005 [Vampirovibrionales bacterium]